MLNSRVRKNIEKQIEKYTAKLDSINKEEMSELLATGCYTPPLYRLDAWNYFPVVMKLKKIEITDGGTRCDFTRIRSDGDTYDFYNIFDNIERLAMELGGFSRDKNLEAIWDMLEIQSIITKVNKLTIQALSNKYYLELKEE